MTKLWFPGQTLNKLFIFFDTHLKFPNYNVIISVSQSENSLLIRTSR